MKRYFFTVAVVLAAACTKRQDDSRGHDPEHASIARAETDCGANPKLVLSDSGLGGLRVGRTVNDLKAACRVHRDRVVEGQEAIPERVVEVVLNNDTVTAAVDDDKVWRIEVTSPQFITADSLGVGTRLDRLLAHPGAVGIEGEGLLYVTTQDHCGLSFRLSHVPDDDEHRETWTTDDLRALRGNVVVDEVLIVGCGAR